MLDNKDLKDLVAKNKQLESANLKLKKQLSEYRKLVEQENTDSEQVKYQFNELAEILPEIIFEINTEGAVTYVNQNAFNVLGYEADDIERGLHYSDIIAQEDIERVTKDIMRRFAGEDFQGEEYLALTKDNKKILFSFYTSLIFKNDSVIGLRGIMIDISERQRAVNRLIRFNSLLDAQKEASIDGILVVDENRKVISHNQRYVDMFRIPKKIIDSCDNYESVKHISKFMVKPEAFISKVEKLYKSTTKESRDELKLSDGRVIDRYTTSILSPEGEYLGRVWYFRDLTDRIIAEQKILEEAARVIKFQAVLLKISQLDFSDIIRSFKTVNKLVANTLNVSRVGIRRYNADRSILICDDLYILAEKKHVSGHDYVVDHFPKFFSLAEKLRVVAVDDIINDKRTKEFSPELLNRLDMRSILVTPFRSKGMVTGVVSCVAIKEKRIWTVEEQNFVASVADLISMAIYDAERREREEQLRAREDLFRRLTNTVNSAIFIIQNERFVFINQAGEEILGYKADEIKNMTFWDLIHPDYTEMVRERVVARRKGEDISNRYEFAVSNPKSGQRWIDYSTSSIDYDGKPAILGTGFDITDRKLVEKAHRESEVRYKKLIEGAAEGILVANLETKEFIYANKAICDLLGYTYDEFLCLGVIDIHPGEAIEHVIHEFELQAQGKKTTAYDLPVLKKDGTILSVNISTSMQVIDGIECNVGFFQDITDYKRAVQALEESEFKYNSIVENANELIIVIQDGYIKFFNSKIQDYLDLPADEIMRLTFLDFVHPDDRSIVEERYRKRIKGEKVESTYEFRSINGRGDASWMLISSVQIMWEGKPAILSSLTNISKRKLAETSLVRESTINQAIASLSQELLSPALSINKIADTVLENAKRITGSQQGFVSFIDSETKDNIVLAFYNDSGIKQNNSNQVLSSEKLEAGYKGLIGYALNEEKAFFTNDPSSHSAYVGVPEDHFEINKFLSVPAFLNNELVGEISLANSPDDYQDVDLESVQRLADLYAIAIYRKQSENELVKARQKAVESDKLKTAFLGNMSHEIRTPMNAIVGFTELLMDMQASKSQLNEYLGYIKASSKVLLNLIDDIIDVSKIEAGQLPINYSQFNVHHLLNELKALFDEEKMNIDKSHIEINLHLASKSEDVILDTDHYRLRQVLTNLIGNAMKFTDSGFIEFGYNVQETNYIMFYVKDTGVGLARDKHEVIFNRFVQVVESKSKSYGGTGLGLSISKDLVEILGGKIWLNSALGEGSTFYFTLPYKQSSKKVKKQISKPIQSTDFDWSSNKILIVEDEETNIRLLQALLSKTGVEILLARNGFEAVEACKVNDDIDLVLMDIQLPVLDGYDATRQIRTFREKLPIIAQTAFAMSDDKIRIMTAGFDNYIVKPLKRTELLNLVAGYL